MRTGELSGIRVRDFRLEDLEGCLRVFDSNVPRFFRDHEREEFETFLKALPGPYSVLETREGELVGCGGYAVVPQDQRADLCWGMVRADLHGRGLGRLLTETRLRGAAANPLVRTIAIHTSQHTRGFYEGMGFRMVELLPDGYAPGLHRCEMRLDVPGPPGSGSTG